MRLQLVALFALLSVSASAQQLTTGRFDSYVDGKITVLSPAMTGRVVFGPVVLDAEYDVDMVSGATRALSVDAVTGATRFSEIRHGANVGVEAELGDSAWRVNGGYRVSVESDYLTHAVRLGVVSELLDNMSTLSLNWALSIERLGSVDDSSLSERSFEHRFDVGWDQILTRRLTLRLAVTTGLRHCAERYGCSASPYRYVALDDPLGGVLATAERHPALRWHGALTAGMAWFLGAGFALHADWRGYLDTWGVRGHADEVSVAWGAFAERLVLRLGLRVGQQSAARLYEKNTVTTVVPEYRTADRELSGLWNVGVTANADWSFLNVGPLNRLGVNVRMTRLWYRYPNFAILQAVDAWVAGGGLHAEF